MKIRSIKNWQTTLAGLIGAAAVAASAAIEASAGVPSWQAVGTAAAIAAIGYLAHDGRV